MVALAGNMLKENGNILITSDKIITRISKWEKYQDVNINGNTWIFGTDKNSCDRDIWIEDFIDNRKCLDDIIALVCAERKCREKRVPLTKRWCKKWGLPFIGANFNHPGFSYDDSLISCPAFLENVPPNTSARQIIGFNLKDFWIAIQNIYIFFLMASLLLGIDIGSNDIDDTKRLTCLSEQDLREHLSLGIQMARVGIRFKFENEKPYLFTFAESLPSLALYQLALLCLSPNGMYVRRCDCCGSLFIAKRRNNIHCSNCYPQKKYNRDKRKELHENGEHNKG